MSIVCHVKHRQDDDQRRCVSHGILPGHSSDRIRHEDSGSAKFRYERPVFTHPPAIEGVH